MLSSHLLISFKINFLEKNISGIPPECQTVWFQIWVQTVLQRLSADGTVRQIVKMCYAIVVPGMKYCF